MRSFALPCAAVFIVLLALGGCATRREITITARPEDATIAIDGQDQGHAPVKQKFVFHGDQEQHTVTAWRIGFKDQTVTLTRDFNDKILPIELKPQTKRVTITVGPVPAVLRVDEKPLSAGPVAQATVDLEFTADAQGHWTHHTVVAERANWEKAQSDIKWVDPPTYALRLGTLKKDLTIATTPPGAAVVLNGKPVGESPVKLKDVPFPADPATSALIPQRVTINKPGYDPIDANVNWDNGRVDYHVNIAPKTKEVHIATDPPGATVTVGSEVLDHDNLGSAVMRMVFAPTDENGTLPVYKAMVTKNAGQTEWYPKEVAITWDEGRTDYTVTLKEIRTKLVPLLLPHAVRKDDGWKIEAGTLSVLAMKDVTEAPDREQPTRITDLAKRTIVDSLAISPDGSQLLFTTLSTEAGELHSQIQMVHTDGSGGSTLFGEEHALSLTPSFTPDGAQILFASNRAGKRLSIWQMSAVGEAGVTQLTTGDENALWPVVDSEPKPRLFYTSLVDSLPQPRLYMTRVGAMMRTDLARGGGMQPRINPKGDKLVFCNASEKNGKRQIFVMPDRGGPASTLSDPESDEYDAVWSKDGGKIAFASNRGKDEEAGNNYDIWVLDLAHPDRPIQVTQNGSWDDRPAWDPAGKSLYFRSNRGGEWGIWKISLPGPSLEGAKASRR